ncbi:tetratricopeptide repeat protein [Spirulina sp. CCNP1310]|uniref:tetratricopeptide repeat protein n=1 Tax=Spirulina sp. CCNP1310 TaxID=3110249 RepID=UPI002B200F2C|nr:tetratricopeptide repeat protein [Spirulina sp. CCNP1310]MEA5421362.1 tetratricopeptide repeat protein [Spirulina sp. CCNP1310]
MNTMQTVLNIAELSEMDLPHIRYDISGQLVIFNTEFIADYADVKSEAITQPSTQLRTLNAWEQAHLDYVFYWLNIYEPRENTSDLKEVEGYLEAFYHLCELSLWKEAYQVVCITIDGDSIHEKLGSWGYYIQQIEIYEKLLNKLDSSVDCICLYGLGSAFYFLGQRQKSFKCHKAQLRIARKTQNHEYECLAWKGLGLNYHYYDKNKAIRCHSKQLTCAELHLISTQKLSAILELSHVHGCWWTNVKLSLYYSQLAFDLAKKMGDKKIKFMATKELLSTWLFSREYRKIKNFLVNHEAEFLKDLQDLSLQEQVLGYELIGRSFVLINDHEKFIYFFHQCLTIWQRIKHQISHRNTLQKYDCPTEHQILHNLGTVYCLKLKNPQAAVQYLEQAYEVGKKGNNFFMTATTLSVLAHCYSMLGKIPIAQERGQAALALAEEINSPILCCYAMTGLASVAWHQGHYLRSVRLILQGLWGAQAWQTTNVQLIIKTVLGLIADKLPW